MSDLRAALIPHMERFPTDVALGKYGDPHVAFVVMVSPDEPPTIAVITGGHSPVDVRHLDAGTTRDEVNAPTDHRDFTYEDMEQASEALRAWLFAWRWCQPEEGQTRGDAAYEDVARRWRRSRERVEEEAMAAIAYELDHPHVCDICQRRFKTERGMEQHRSYHSPQATERPAKPRRQRTEYRCDGCKMPFPTAAACSRHQAGCWIAQAATEDPS